MKLIVGLGNPGEKYIHNRHNVGFMMVDAIIKQLGITDYKLKNDKKFKAEIGEASINNNKIILVKPQTFMNNSGEAVQKIKDFYKIIPQDIIVIHDDLDVKFGEYKIQVAKGPKIHNGILSIEQHLSSKDFTRIRIGVDNRDLENRMPGEAYVLNDFNEDEIKVLEDLFISIYKQILSLLFSPNPR